MNRFLLVSVCFVAAFYVYNSGNKRRRVDRPPPALILPARAAVPESELEIIRKSTFDSDPNVRWAAVELLYTLRDPQARKLLEHIMKTDTDQTVRRNAINLLRSNDKGTHAADLTVALRDTEKAIRVAALQAIAEKDDLIFIPYIYGALVDSEPDVRLQALASLRIIQERKRKVYEELKARLRYDYERSIRKRS